jgi:hypothetical protein
MAILPVVYDENVHGINPPIGLNTGKCLNRNLKCISQSPNQNLSIFAQIANATIARPAGRSSRGTPSDLRTAEVVVPLV